MFFLLLAILPFISRPAIAQDASPSAVSPTPTPDLYAQYQTDYTYQYSLYQQSYLQYVDKKQVYTKYGSVSTQKDKFDAAKTTLTNRNNAFIAYLMALRVSLDKYQSVDPTATEKQKIELSKWEDYFREQNTILSAISHDSDLKTWTQGFQQKYIEIQQAIYTALTVGQINQRLTTLKLILSLADSVKSSPRIQTDNSQWYSDLNVQADLVNQAAKASQALTQKNQYQIKFINFYPDVRANLDKIDTYLGRMLSNLKIIINQNYHE